MIAFLKGFRAYALAKMSLNAFATVRSQLVSPGKSDRVSPAMDEHSLDP